MAWIKEPRNALVFKYKLKTTPANKQMLGIKAFINESQAMATVSK